MTAASEYNVHIHQSSNDDMIGFRARLGAVIGPTNDFNQPRVTLVFRSSQRRGPDGTRVKTIRTTTKITIDELKRMIQMEELPRGIKKDAAEAMLKRLEKKQRTTTPAMKESSLSTLFCRFGRIREGHNGLPRTIELIVFEQNQQVPRGGKPKPRRRVRTETLTTDQLSAMIDTGSFPEGINRRTAWGSYRRLQNSPKKA